MLCKIILAVALLLPAASAAAENYFLTPNDGKWGAIAYGGPDKAMGTAVDFPSADAARQAAFDNCAGKCTRAIVFLRTCGAVAEEPAGRGWGWASNRWRGRAIARALALCERSASGCSAIAWACTTH
jgi:hypothetical protein